MILPSPMMTTDAQLQILRKKKCTLYVRADSMAPIVDAVVRCDSGIEIVGAPKLESLLQVKLAQAYVYSKSWAEGRDDPWSVFHTSGTTGKPTSKHPQYSVWPSNLLRVLQDIQSQSHIKTE